MVTRNASSAEAWSRNGRPTTPKISTTVAPACAIEAGRGPQGAAGGDEVVDQEHPHAGGKIARVHLDHVLAVLEGEARPQRLPGQLALLAHQHQGQLPAHRVRRGEQEAARLDRGDGVERRAVVQGGHAVDAARVGFGLHQDAGEIVEEHARTGEVGHGTYGGLDDLIAGHREPP